MAHAEVPCRIENMGIWDHIRSAFEYRYDAEPFWRKNLSMDWPQLALDCGFNQSQAGFQKATPKAIPGDSSGFISLAEGKQDLSNWYGIIATK